MKVLGITIALGATAVLGLLSGVPYRAESGDHAIIRLAWQARGERAHRCRPPTDDELAKLPQHMRPQEICERGITDYRLRVRLDGQPVVDELVRAGGAQSDRPLFVFHDLSVSAGEHRMDIRFERAEQENEEERDADDAGDARETPRRLTLDETVTLAPGVIVLVTYDYERRRLALLAGRHADP